MNRTPRLQKSTTVVHSLRRRSSSSPPPNQTPSSTTTLASASSASAYYSQQPSRPQIPRPVSPRHPSSSSSRRTRWLSSHTSARTASFSFASSSRSPPPPSLRSSSPSTLSPSSSSRVKPPGETVDTARPRVARRRRGTTHASARNATRGGDAVSICLTVHEPQFTPKGLTPGCTFLHRAHFFVGSVRLCVCVEPLGIVVGGYVDERSVGWTFGKRQDWIICVEIKPTMSFLCEKNECGWSSSGI